MPDSFQLRRGRSQNEHASSGSTMRTTTAAVHCLCMAVFRVAVYGNLQTEFRRSFSHGETRLSDTRQSQGLLGDKEYTISRNPCKHEEISQQQCPRRLQTRSTLDFGKSATEKPEIASLL